MKKIKILKQLGNHNLLQHKKTLNQQITHTKPITTIKPLNRQTCDFAIHTFFHIFAPILN